MENKGFKFVQMRDKVCKVLTDKTTEDYLMKWSMKGNLQVQYYCFNQPFHTNHKQEFAEAFFKDPVVCSTLLCPGLPVGNCVIGVFVETVPCTITSMDFFDPLLKPDNYIVHCDNKTIVQCQDEEIDGFYIADNLRNMLLNEKSDIYKLFSESNRKQFLFRIFQHICLGGQWCQYEDTVEPYLNTAKQVYKELISVEHVCETKELVVRTIVLKVHIRNDENVTLFPGNTQNVQDFLYLVIDPFKRTVSVLTHTFGGACIL